MYTDYSYLAPNAEEYAFLGGTMAGAFAGIVMFLMVFGFIVSVLSIIANWKIFSKAGQAGWKCLIPIYNTVILFRIAGVSPWLILLYFTAIIPVIGWMIVLGITIYVMFNLAKAFGKDGAFTVGLVLLNTIFMMILGFGKSEYQLNKSDMV